jgi:hypothetical protein
MSRVQGTAAGLALAAAVLFVAACQPSDSNTTVVCAVGVVSPDGVHCPLGIGRDFQGRS